MKPPPSVDPIDVLKEMKQQLDEIIGQHDKLTTQAVWFRLNDHIKRTDKLLLQLKQDSEQLQRQVEGLESRVTEAAKCFKDLDKRVKDLGKVQ